VTDTKNLAAAVRGRATAGAPSPMHQSPGGRRRIDVLMRRWPTAVAIAVAALTLFDQEEVNAAFVSSFSALTVAMALVYVAAAALDRPRSAWPVLLIAFAVLALTQALDPTTNLPLIFLVAALAFLALGAARGQLRRPSGLALQAAGMLVFGAAGLVAFSADPTLGGYLVAFALLGHAAWDAYHYLRARAVTRSYAEFCGALDLLVGAAALFLLVIG